LYKVILLKKRLKYLGLDKYLQGNESVTKEELLKFVDQKNIADKLSVVEVPLEDQLDFSQYSIGGAGGKRARASESTREVLLINVEIPTMEGYINCRQYVFKVDGPK
jgi:transcription antitermination factor NusG